MEKEYCSIKSFNYNSIIQKLSSYAVDPDKISESPASNIAIVEHLNNFPQAVPSSI